MSGNPGGLTANAGNAKEENSSKADKESASSISKTWELNIYELNRMPHEIIVDDSEIAVSPKVLQNELMCPICLDILKNTMTTKECLHRFCHDCIITALRAGNKECPTCRKKLVSKRSLRPDPNFDGIIAKIYPNRAEYDALHEKVLEKLNKKHLTAVGVGLNTSAASRATHRANGRKNKEFTAANMAAQANAATIAGISNMKISGAGAGTVPTTSSGKRGASSCSSSTANACPGREEEEEKEEEEAEEEMGDESSTDETVAGNDEMRGERGGGGVVGRDEVEIVMKPHPDREHTLQSKRFLKTTSNATIDHLANYLYTRLCVEAATTPDSTTTTSTTTTTTTTTTTPTSTENNSKNNASKEPTGQATTSSGGDGDGDGGEDEIVNDFQLYIINSGNNKEKTAATLVDYKLLDQTLTLEGLVDKLWRPNRPIELFYVYKPKSNNNIVSTDAPPSARSSRSNSTSSSSTSTSTSSSLSQ